MKTFLFTEIIVGSFVGPSQQTNFQRPRKVQRLRQNSGEFDEENFCGIL